MTIVNIDLAAEIAAAGFEPAGTGVLMGRYLNEIVDGDTIIGTTEFPITIVDGVGTADVHPTPPGNGLRLRSPLGSPPHGFRTRAVEVPDSVTPVNLADLNEINPKTAAPPEVADAIAQAFDQLQTTVAELEAGVGPAIITAITEVIDGAPDTLNTFYEIATALGNNENLASTLINSIAEKADSTRVDELEVEVNAKVDAASNLADLANAAAARTNLGLGSAATSDADNFATPDLGTRLAYAVNETGVPTGYGSAAVDLAYAVIVVPPSPDRDVWIEWGTTFYVTTVAHGTLKSMMHEVTGADTFREYAASDVSANGLGSADPHSSHRGSYFLGRTTTYRTFIVKLITTKKTGVTYPAGGVFNGYQGINPKSWIGAFAR